MHVLQCMVCCHGNCSKKAAWQQLAMFSHEWSPCPVRWRPLPRHAIYDSKPQWTVSLPCAVEVLTLPCHLRLQAAMGARGVMREAAVSPDQTTITCHITNISSFMATGNIKFFHGLKRRLQRVAIYASMERSPTMSHKAFLPLSFPPSHSNCYHTTHKPF